MNEFMQPTTNRIGIGMRKLISVVIGLALVSGALYASRSPILQAHDQNSAQKQSTTNGFPAVLAAQKFLNSLDGKRNEVLYEFGSAKKSNWSNLPVTMVARNGVRLGDLSAPQRGFAMQLLAAVLSKNGLQKVVDIMDSDQQLVNARGGNRNMFGVDQYYLAIFGKPSDSLPWMVQFGGHHLGINVTIIGKQFILTPTHTGAQPASFQREGKLVRPLGLENDVAFKLVNAFDEKQRSKAILAARPQSELLLGPGRDGKRVDPEGIKGDALTRAQQSLLQELIGTWVTMVDSDSATKRMDEIKATISETYFAWKGPISQGSAVYFRIQGPSIFIEYAPQGGTDHIHTVIRNPQDEYGAGLLQQKKD